MDIYNTFQELVSNLIIQNQDQIESRFSLITKKLNADFHGIESDSDNGIYVGSYGRNTAINGISDLDMIFELPSSLYTQYNGRSGNKQSQLLQTVKDSIQQIYSQSEVRGDGQVVSIKFKNDYLEICPAFRDKNDVFTYPDSNNGGKWKKTNPLPEAETINKTNQDWNDNLIHLCRIARAWKNKSGVKINGLLIDTFAYNFITSDENYKTINFSSYDIFLRDFFIYLKSLDKNQTYWYAPGSNQKVYNKNSNFHSKAKKALKLIEEAIDKKENKTVFEIWRKVFGKNFPYPNENDESNYNYCSTEEFIEDKFHVNITNSIKIDCEVTQTGFRVGLLREMKILKKNKKLRFFISNIDVQPPYEILWKVKNEGELARNRKMWRGQIIESNFNENERKESSDFEGEHYMECYIIKDGYCVAVDRIDVPITNV
jgi:hypothetical protein